MIEHFKLKPIGILDQSLLTVISWFPGVSIFFAISGFLFQQAGKEILFSCPICEIEP